MEKCQHSIKATFKRVKSLIQKGADPERAVRRGYEHTCDYFEIMNQRILIQQRALGCLSKSVAHILQRELYTMGITGLLKHEAETTLLQPHLGDCKRQELRNSPFWPTPLSKSQSRMEKTSSLKRTTEVVFDPIQGDEGMETPPPNDSLQASLSPPVGGRLRSFRRDWPTNKCSDMLNIITNGYVLPFISKPNLVEAPLIRSGYKALQKEQTLASCIQSLLSKNAIERVEIVTSLGFYSHLFLVLF